MLITTYAQLQLARNYKLLNRNHDSLTRNMIDNHDLLTLNYDVISRNNDDISFNINSSPLVPHMRQCMRSALVQMMACRLFGAKPLSKPMLG